MLVVDQGRHGGVPVSMVVFRWMQCSGGVSVSIKADTAAIKADKRINQPATEQHGNTEKLKVCLARAETDRRAPATVKRGRR